MLPVRERGAAGGTEPLLEEFPAQRADKCINKRINIETCALCGEIEEVGTCFDVRFPRNVEDRTSFLEDSFIHFCQTINNFVAT